MSMKGISPLIASVVLIAFTISAAGLLSSWMGGLQKTQTTLVGERGTNQTKCVYSYISMSKADISSDFTHAGTAADPDQLNATVSYDDGTENIYGFTFFISTNVSSYRQSPPSSEMAAMQPGELRTFHLNITDNNVQGGLAKLRVTATCGNVLTASYEVKM